MSNKFKILIFLVLLFFQSYGQLDSIRLDSKTRLTYDKNNNLSTGIFKDFYKNGNLKEYWEFENGISILSKHYDKKGKLIDSTIYHDNHKKFTSYFFQKNGNLKSSYTYLCTKIEKDSIYCYDTEAFALYYKTGVKKLEQYSIKGTNKYYETEYYENGNIMSKGLVFPTKPVDEYHVVVGFLRDSIYTEYFENGIIKLEANYTNGKLNGSKKDFYPNGKIKMERFYEDGKFTNPAYDWDSEGRKFEVVYVIEFGQPSSVKSKTPMIQ